MSSSNALLDAALAYARRGWPIFPLTRSKKPLKGSHGYLDGSSDPAVAERRWSAAGELNIAVSTGGAWGIVVFDADGPGGLAQFGELAKQFGKLPDTLAARTPRGGWHFYFQLPAGRRLRKRTGKRAQKGDDGLDLQADKAYALLPPSRTAKGAYTWANDLATAELPEAWVDGLERLNPPPPAQAPVALLDLGAPPAWLTGLPTANVSDALNKSFVASELPEFLQALKLLDPAMSYDEWFEVGAGTYDFSPDMLGLQIFTAWSVPSKRHSPPEAVAACQEKWLEYAKPKPGKRLITKSHIYFLAGEARGAQAREILDPPAADEDEEEEEQEAAPTDDAPPLVVEANGTVHLPASFTAAPEVAIVFPDVNRAGRPVATCRNARVAIRRLGLTCEHDVFHGRLKVGGAPLRQWAGELTDDATHMLRVIIEQQFHFDPGTLNTHDAAVQECLQHAYDPVCQFLDGLAWDGRPRLDTWMHAYLGAELTPFTSAVARLSLLAAVRRARRPGAKFDQIIVLESPEGRGKSSAIELLAGADNYSDQTILGLSDREVQEAVQGVWLYEIADLSGHTKADIEREKAFSSRTCDRARPAYGRARADRPRRCVFFATTNSDTYLKSQTGNRRFWPVRCGHILLDELGMVRDQLWAEAAHVERGASLVLPGALWADAAAEQEGRRDHDPWDDVLAGDIGTVAPDGERRVSSRELLDGRLKLTSERQTDVAFKRLGYVMRRLGWDGPKVYRDGVFTIRGYTRPVPLLHVGVT